MKKIYLTEEGLWPIYLKTRENNIILSQYIYLKGGKVMSINKYLIFTLIFLGQIIYHSMRLDERRTLV